MVDHHLFNPVVTESSQSLSPGPDGYKVFQNVRSIREKRNEACFIRFPSLAQLRLIISNEKNEKGGREGELLKHKYDTVSTKK